MFGKIFGNVMLVSWRMLAALFIGLALYIYVFLNHGALYNSIFDVCNDAARWVFNAISEGRYTKWNNALQIGDQLVFMVFVVVGRLIWLLFEFIAIRAGLGAFFKSYENTSKGKA